MTKKILAGFAGLLVLAAGGVVHAARVKVKQPLAATAAGGAAKGLAKLALKSTSEGEFEVRVRRLDRNATYAIIVGGTRVADLRTTGGGQGAARFRTRPRSSRDLPLGFDPRGASVVVRNANGDDVLGVDFPDDHGGNDGDVACCLPDDSGPECEDRTAAECAAEGGSVSGALSCLPNPCAGATPVEDEDKIVCCIPDDSGPECEDRTQERCLAEGGTVVQATSCVPNPCAATPPPAGNDVICCLPDNGGDGLNECEDRTAEACTAAGGTVSAATSCTPNPCGGSHGSGRGRH